jgi:hypothetical protein
VYYAIADDSVMELCDLVCGAVESRAKRVATALR